MNHKITLSAIFAVALGLGAYFAIGTSNQVSSTSGLSLTANAQTAAEVDTSSVIDMTMGQQDAPITVIEYASFTCPHCASFHDQVLGRLKADYIDTGKVKFIHREVYFDKFGLWAGMVARCAGPIRYFGITDMIYSEQQEWIGSGTPAEIDKNLRTLGLRAGLDQGQIDACLKDADKAQALIATFQTNSKADDISSTPSFIIDGEKHSNMSYDEFKSILDKKLGE